MTSDPWLRKPAKDDKLSWWKMNNSMVNQTGDINDMAMTLAANHAIGPWFSQSYRHYDDFVCAQHIAIDLDNETLESSIDVVLSIPIVANHAAIVYSTQSSRIGAERCRIVFAMGHPELNPEAHRARTRAIAWALDADVQATDPARLFQGMGGEEPRMIVLGHVMDVSYADQVADDYQQCHRPRVYMALPNDGIVPSAIRLAQSGNRNAIGFWLATKLRDSGLSVDEAGPSMLAYQAAVGGDGGEEYSVNEATQSLRSAYSRRSTK